MARREPRFNQNVLIDTTHMPDEIPKEQDVDHIMMIICNVKPRAFGRGELDCLKEGRKVTRCAASVLKDINENCLTEFRAHWTCLENNNQQLWQCRRPERILNRCVFQKVGLEKVIPDTPKGETPVHLKDKQLYAVDRVVVYPWEKDVGIRRDGTVKGSQQTSESLAPTGSKTLLTTPAVQKS